MTIISAMLAIALTSGADPPYAGRSLAEVLTDLQRHGVRVVFSTELVVGSMRVVTEPRASEPRRILDEILKPHRLAIRPGPGGVLQVVRAQDTSRVVAPIDRASTPTAKPARTSESSDGAAYAERVTVTASSGATFDAATREALTLGRAELGDLPGAVAEDPMRAAAALPGASTADDLRSEFSVRGAAYRQTGIVIEGVPTKWLQHTALGAGDTGSLGMVNPLVVDRVALSTGTYPHTAGDWLGPQLELTLRDGSRTSPRMRGLASGTSATLAAEGPLGRSGRGSWIAAVRQSYREWPGDVAARKPFGYADAQVKLVFDFTPAQQATIVFVGGRSRIDERGSGTAADLAIADNDAAVLSVGWQSTLSRSLVARQRISVAAHRFADFTEAGENAGRGRDRHVIYDGNVTGRAFGGLVQAGIQAGSAASMRSWPTVRRNAEGSSRAAFVAGTWTLARTLTFAPGVRIGGNTMVRTPSVSRWITTAWTPAQAWTLHASAGVFEASPGVDEFSDAPAAPAIRPERATLFDASIEHALGGGLRWQAGVFSRGERDLLREPAYTIAIENGVTGTSRGVELLLASRGSRRTSGWIAYAYSRTHRIDLPTGAAYWSPMDQRHGLNAAAIYHVAARTTASAMFRTGSNVPAPGTTGLETARLPAYARLDLRVSHALDAGGRHLTLFAEVLNALNRRNVGVGPSGAVLLFPRVPSAGLLVEF